MPAPLGNQYALGGNGGRPTKYKPEYCDMIIEHFQKEPVITLYKEEYNRDGSLKCKTPIITAAQFPTFQSFAANIGVNIDTLHEWKKIHEDFSESYARAQELQEHIWLVNSMSNLYNSQFAQFFGTNCLGYKNKSEITGANGGPIQLAAVNYSALTTQELEELEAMASKALPE